MGSTPRAEGPQGWGSTSSWETQMKPHVASKARSPLGPGSPLTSLSLCFPPPVPCVSTSRIPFIQAFLLPVNSIHMALCVCQAICNVLKKELKLKETRGTHSLVGEADP